MYYFIVNPNSKCGKGLAVWKEVLRHIQKSKVKIDYEVYMTAKAGDAREFTRKLTGKCREDKTITVIGGDGTLNEVVDGTCMNCGNISIAFIPTGTGNDFARSFKMHHNLRKQLERLHKLELSRANELVDYGVLNCAGGNRRFVVSAGIGFDAAICQDILDSPLKEKLNRLCLGKLVYLAVGVKQLFQAKPTHGYIVLDGDKRYEFNNILFVSAHVHPYEGGGFKLAPAADCRDGLIDLCVVSCCNKFHLISVMLSALTGTHTRLSGVHTYRCSSVQIHTDRLMPVHTDGESCGVQTDLTLNCVQRRLKVKV